MRGTFDLHLAVSCTSDSFKSSVNTCLWLVVNSNGETNVICIYKDDTTRINVVAFMFILDKFNLGSVQ